LPGHNNNIQHALSVATPHASAAAAAGVTYHHHPDQRQVAPMAAASRQVVADAKIHPDNEHEAIRKQPTSHRAIGSMGMSQDP